MVRALDKLALAQTIWGRMAHVDHFISFQILKYVQGDPKKMSLSVFELKSVLDVGFDFSACVLESEFRARFI